MIDDTFLICPRCLCVLPYNHFIHSSKIETVVKNRGGLCNLCVTIKQNISKSKSINSQLAKKALKLDNDVKNGIKKQCIRCKRYFFIKYLDLNLICKRCKNFVILVEYDRKIDLSISLSTIESKKILIRDFNTPSFLKEEKINDLEKKVLEFLHNKEQKCLIK